MVGGNSSKYKMANFLCRGSCRTLWGRLVFSKEAALSLRVGLLTSHIKVNGIIQNIVFWKSRNLFMDG
jgi:hypothetical protein